MALSKQKKIEKVKALKERAQSANALFAVSYKGVKTSELTAIRRGFREEGIGSIVIAKNTLGRVAFAESEFAGSAPLATGNLAYIFARDEAPVVAKKIIEFNKLYENFEPQFAVVESVLYDRAGVTAISKLPTREMAIAQLMSVLNAPTTRAAMLFKELIARLVRVIDGVAREKSRTLTN